jgi:hypothetical protein
MVLDDEDAVVAERLGFDDVIDPLLEALAAVEVRPAALGRRAAEESEFHRGFPAPSESPLY